jgi:hypothetical protein
VRNNEDDPAVLLFEAATSTVSAATTVIKWSGLNEPTVIDRIAAIEDPAAAKRVQEWDDAMLGVLDWNSVKFVPPT